MQYRQGFAASEFCVAHSVVTQHTVMSPGDTTDGNCSLQLSSSSWVNMWCPCASQRAVLFWKRFKTEKG